MRQSKKEVDDLSYQIIGAAIEVHRNIGPGFLESVYQKCFAIELDERKLTFQQELELPFSYKNHTIVGHFRCDFFVENLIVVEIKAVSEILPIHQAQVINYMNLLQIPKGILLNFNVINLFHQGQKTFVNRYYDSM
ncbi:GxxExxY protein [Algoriphagus boritolerans]|uniref:GxxExxY protein n=1 Tax=Algoriphagus boritolerans DSM 17298 = JCM 18970 TaxID=1120964 RepID=A0A1H5U7Y4_9BACT|nr:GxxExxY protein [Algoriphagus boritolerans]SEF70538.1 GxxExxY protein [Algoriphagus boritolerans DSM 17298 = JCM 18970]